MFSPSPTTQNRHQSSSNIICCYRFIPTTQWPHNYLLLVHTPPNCVFLACLIANGHAYHAERSLNIWISNEPWMQWGIPLFIVGYSGNLLNVSVLELLDVIDKFSIPFWDCDYRRRKNQKILKYSELALKNFVL